MRSIVARSVVGCSSAGRRRQTRRATPDGEYFHHFRTYTGNLRLNTLAHFFIFDNLVMIHALTAVVATMMSRSNKQKNRGRGKTHSAIKQLGGPSAQDFHRETTRGREGGRQERGGALRHRRGSHPVSNIQHAGWVKSPDKPGGVNHPPLPFH